MSDQLIEFAQKHAIDIDRLYIDRFWSSLYADKWIHIDNDIVSWIGYEEPRTREGKRYLLTKLRTHFKEDIDFKLVALSDIDQYDCIAHIDSSMINAHKTLIVNPDVFKELLLGMNTSKARQVQKYYITVERMCRMYMHEQLANQIACVPEVPRMRLDLNECVYVVSSNTYAQSNMYKIGRTKNLKARISCMNTSNPDKVNDRLRAFLVIKCFDSKSFEAMIHAHLDAYRHSDSKEWFCINYNKLINVVEHFQRFAQASCDIINDIDQMNFDQIGIDSQLAIEDDPETKPALIETKPPVEINRTASGKYQCANCNRVWAANNSFYQRHIQFCK